MAPTKRAPIHTRDTDHEEIVRVPLANHSKPAKIFKEDFDAVLAAGYTHNWTFNDAGAGRRYVRVGACKRRGNLAVVARLILNAPPGRIVHYRDGNHLNLRRDNLVLAQGNAKGVTMKDEAGDVAA